MPPFSVAVPLAARLPLCCGVAATWNVEPGWNVTLPPTFSAAPGCVAAAVAPFCTTRPPTVPVPVSVAPLCTVTVDWPSEPLTARVPALTVVGPLSVLAPVRVSCPLPAWVREPVPDSTLAIVTLPD